MGLCRRWIQDGLSGLVAFLAAGAFPETEYSDLDGQSVWFDLGQFYSSLSWCRYLVLYTFGNPGSGLVLHSRSRRLKSAAQRIFFFSALHGKCSCYSKGFLLETPSGYSVGPV